MRVQSPNHWTAREFPQFLLTYIPRVGCLGHLVVLFVIFLGTSIPFSVMTTPIYIPTNSTQVFPFLHPSPTLAISCLFDNSHSKMCEVVSHCGFDLHFPGD